MGWQKVSVCGGRGGCSEHSVREFTELVCMG
jgi:hypothetical protein